MRQWRQIAACPHRSLLWNHWVHAGIQQIDQQLQQFRAHTAEPLRQNVGAQKQHGPRLRFGERFAHSACVAAHKVDLQLCKLVAGDAYICQLAEPGVHAVHSLSGSENVLNQNPTFFYPPERISSHFHAASCQRNGFDLGQRQGLSIQNQLVHTCDVRWLTLQAKVRFIPAESEYQANPL